jgi:hypothetical protein
MVPLTYYQKLDDQQQLISSCKQLIEHLQQNTTTLENDVVTAFEHLIHILDIHQADATGLETAELTEIGMLGMHLLDSILASANKKPETQSLFNYIALSFGFWVTRNKGILQQIDHPVNALANAANTLHDKVSLEALFEAAAFIILQTDESIKTAADRLTLGTPWYVLNMNFGIIATRTHTPELMESAYETLTYNYPEEAPSFFRKAMSEMERLNYPQHVKTIVEQYHEQYRLH